MHGVGTVPLDEHIERDPKDACSTKPPSAPSHARKKRDAPFFLTSFFSFPPLNSLPQNVFFRASIISSRSSSGATSLNAEFSLVSMSAATCFTIKYSSAESSDRSVPVRGGRYRRPCSVTTCGCGASTNWNSSSAGVGGSGATLRTGGPY